MSFSDVFRLDGQVAIVTGGGAGIGRGIAELFAAAGAAVVVSDLKNETADVVAQGIGKSGGTAIAIACDVTDEAARAALVEAAVKEFGKVTTLVNNAGGGGPKPFDMPLETFVWASKAAVNHLTRNMAFDLGPKGIRVNAIAPGAIRTDALASVLEPEVEKAMLQHTPLGRLGEAKDIAQAAVFFCSPASAWVSGQVLTVSGGGVQELD